MVRHRRRAVYAAAVAATAVGFGLGSARSAAAAEPTTQELMEQIKALRAKVEQLETTQDAKQNEEDARYVDNTVAKVSALLDGLSVANLVYRSVSRAELRRWVAETVAAEVGVDVDQLG